MKFLSQKMISVLFLFSSLFSCQNRKQQIESILNIPYNDNMYIEERALNESLKTPKWIYLVVPNNNELKSLITPNLVERRSNKANERLCVGFPKYYNTSEGFWNLDETDFTKKKQKEILNSIKDKPYKEMGGYYSENLKSFVRCEEEWDGRALVYITENEILILILQMTTK